MQTYSDESRREDPYALPDVEVFYVTQADAKLFFEIEDGEGWFYWYCFPGCLPDSEPIGPFDTYEEAEADAQEQSA